MWDWNIVWKIWLCLLIAAILGGIIGWLLKTLFGSKCEKCEGYEGILRDRNNEIAKLKASLGNIATGAKAENAKDETEIILLKKQIKNLESDLNVCHERQFTLEGELKDHSTKAVGLSSAGGFAAGSGNSAELEADIRLLRTKLQEAESEKLYLLGRVKQAESGEVLTVVPMDQRDDLELVNGIGPVLERMLYDMGIYFFKDIASWNTAKIAEVNEKLPGFQGRIEREGWVESAKEEHFKKYGEKL